MDKEKRGRIFWPALAVYAVWLTVVLRHAIGNNKPMGSLLVLSIVPPLVVVLLWRQSEKWRAKKP
jgi:Na+/proline symporter